MSQASSVFQMDLDSREGLHEAGDEALHSSNTPTTELHHISPDSSLADGAWIDCSITPETTATTAPIPISQTSQQKSLRHKNAAQIAHLTRIQELKAWEDDQEALIEADGQHATAPHLHMRGGVDPIQEHEMIDHTDLKDSIKTHQVDKWEWVETPLPSRVTTPVNTWRAVSLSSLLGMESEAQSESRPSVSSSGNGGGEAISPGEEGFREQSPAGRAFGQRQPVNPSNTEEIHEENHGHFDDIMFLANAIGTRNYDPDNAIAAYRASLPLRTLRTLLFELQYHALSWLNASHLPTLFPNLLISSSPSTAYTAAARLALLPTAVPFPLNTSPCAPISPLVQTMRAQLECKIRKTSDAIRSNPAFEGLFDAHLAAWLGDWKDVARHPGREERENRMWMLPERVFGPGGTDEGRWGKDRYLEELAGELKDLVKIVDEKLESGEIHGVVDRGGEGDGDVGKQGKGWGYVDEGVD